MGHQFAQFRRLRLLPTLLFAAAVASAAAREPAEEFVRGLQERGLHELALEYLEQLKTSPLADEATRQQVPYLRGIALIEQARLATDDAASNQLLDEARRELEHFAEANPHNAQGAEANWQLALVQMSRGKMLLVQQAQLPKGNEYDAQRKTIGHDARVVFADARETFGRAEAIYSAELEKLPPTTGAEARGKVVTQRQDYRAKAADIRYLIAETQFEEARSYPPDADEAHKLNESAAKELSAIYDEFARSILDVAMYARLTEGRCYQAQGSDQLALGCFEEVIRNENGVPVFRKLAAMAVQHKAEVLMAQEKLDLAIDTCKACLKEARKDELTKPEWIGVRFRFAEALTKKAESLPADGNERRRLLADAREAYRAVAKTPGEYQLAARTAAGAATGGKSSPGEKEKEEPKNFQAAYEAGKEALSSYNTAKMALPSAERNNPSAIVELKEQMSHDKDDARRYFYLATTLIEDETEHKQVNEVRYFLCWLYWESGDYYRAAVLGEFLARRYPDHPAASSAAKIALASFEQLYNQAVSRNAKGDGGEFEARSMSQLAEFIARRWPKSQDADSAFAVLVNNAIRNGRIEDAEKLLGDSPEPSRPRLELQLGNSLWEHYFEISQPGQGAPPDNAALEKLKSAALKHLRTGFDAARKEKPISDATVTASLYLTQALLGAGKFPEAIELLEDKKVGPLALISSENPTATRPTYLVEAYKAALRAYVSVTPPQETKAIDTMQSLERAVKTSGDAAKASEQLNRIYIGMGLALQKQIEELRAAGQEQEAKRVTAAIAKFLDRINAQPGTANWPTRVWLAQTYYGMAIDQQPSAQPGSATPVGPENKIAYGYLTRSRDGYEQLLKEAAENPKMPPNDMSVLAVKMQLAECYRALGQYQQALDMFFDVLKQKETSLAAQRAAALTYQERGMREDPKFFESAIHGGYKSEKNNQNRVWGWLKISTVALRAARTDKTFKDTFFEARYNVSRCRYLAAMKKLGDARKKDLATAKDGIQSFGQVYPDMGGEKWKPQFEKLLKEIQQGDADGDEKGSS